MKISKGHNFWMKTASSLLHAYLNIRLSIVLKFQEMPTSGLGGVALTRSWVKVVKTVNTELWAGGQGAAGPPVGAGQCLGQGSRVPEAPGSSWIIAFSNTMGSLSWHLDSYILWVNLAINSPFWRYVQATNPNPILNCCLTTYSNTV